MQSKDHYLNLLEQPSSADDEAVARELEERGWVPREQNFVENPNHVKWFSFGVSDDTTAELRLSRFGNLCCAGERYPGRGCVSIDELYEVAVKHGWVPVDQNDLSLQLYVNGETVESCFFAAEV